MTHIGQAETQHRHIPTVLNFKFTCSSWVQEPKVTQQKAVMLGSFIPLKLVPGYQSILADELSPGLVLADGQMHTHH